MAATRPQNPQTPARNPGDFPAPRREPTAIPPLILGQEEGGLEIAEAGALRELGHRLLPLVECLVRFQEELRAAASGLGSQVEGAPAVQSSVAVLEEILDWAGAVCEELRDEARHASIGQRWTDTGDLLRISSGQLEDRHPGLRITVNGEPSQRCWARPGTVRELFALGLDLVRRRIGGAGAISVEISEERGILRHRILGLGDPVPLDEPLATARFGSLVRELGATVTPDSLGPHGAGMVIEMTAAGSS